MQKKQYSLEVNGKTLIAEFNDLTDQANGSVILKYGNTVVLATAVMSKKAKEGAGWFPLTVDYEERFYAAGKILGGQYTRREGRPSDEAVLSGRIVDRTIRPLFDQYIRNEIQVVITILSIDQDDPDVLGVIAASLAIGTSDIPWNGPVSAVRIAKIKETKDFLINPTYISREDINVELEMIACGKDKSINMIEVGSKELKNEVVAEALQFASDEIEKIQEFQKKIIAEIGKPKTIIPKPEIAPEVAALFKDKIEPKLESAVFSGPGKKNIYGLEEEWISIFTEAFPEGNKSDAMEICEIDVQATSSDVSTQVQNDVTALLTTRHNITDPTKVDFNVLNQASIIATASSVTGTFTTLLAAVAGISLVVGGIGIMNMMLTTVTERTREIGLRKAIGAKKHDINKQFLVEAIMLTFIGGVIGVILGWLIAFG